MEQLNILLVEHNDDLRRWMTAYLNEQPDFTVNGEASNGLEALPLLETNAIDLIVTCILMPVMDGLAMLERIQEMHLEPKPKVIVLSSLARQALMDRACALGAGFYLVKPVDPELLCRCIRKCFSMTYC
jgi:two-component system response regulator (stage 0 sporulation protein A)